MLKLLAQFFSTLAGTHKHDGITHKALEANKLIVAQQLESIAELKKEIQERIVDKDQRVKQVMHLTGQMEKAVREATLAEELTKMAQAEIVELKDNLREAQNNKVATLEVRQINSQLRKEIGELRDEQEQAITMLKSFEVEMRKN